MDSMDRSISDAIQHSVKRLGYTTIRQHQQDILEKLLRGQDCLLVAPTGSGNRYSMFVKYLPTLPLRKIINKNK